MTDVRRAPAQRWLDLGEQQRVAVANTIVELVAAGETPLKVADIAERSGISRPTFYKYFPTLGHAVLHTAGSLHAELEAFIAKRRTAQDSAREELLHWFSLSFEYARSRPEVTWFFSYYDFTFRRSGIPSDEQERRAEISHRAGGPIHALFVAGQRDGSIDADLATDVTFYTLVTSMTGTSQRLLVESGWTNGRDKRARAVHDELIELWRQTLRPTSAE
jgi:AcrR family transcriptional regulator